MTVGGLVGGVGYYIAARRAVPGLSISIGNVERDSIRKLVNFGGWVFVGKLNGVIWHQMDKVILAAVVTSTALAGYDVAYKIQATAAVVLSITASAIMPAASALSAIKDNARLEQLLLRGTRYTIALSLPIVIGAMLMAKPFIEHWVGPQFTDVAAATRLFLVYQFLASSSAIANTMLFGFGDVKICTLYASLAAAINLVVSIFLAQFWGLEGVIAGTLVGHAITTPLFIHRMMRHLDISLGTFLRGTIVPLLPWAAAFAIVLQLIKSALPPTNLFAVLIECVVALGVYATGVALVAMSDEERRTVFGFFKSARVT
jgi:O-antigen/teichoic acid export membrane protein